MAVKSIVVVGAAGKSGSAVVAEALRRGLSVTAHLRSRAKGAHLPAGIDIVEGDGHDAASLRAAIAGHDAVVVTAGGRENPISAEIASAVIAAMKDTGVGRLIVYSAYGGVDGRGFYGWIMRTAAKPIVADKVALEQALATSGLEWTAVRPPILTDGPATGKVLATADALLTGLPRVSRADVAAFTVGELLAPRFIGAAPVLYLEGARKT